MNIPVANGTAFIEPEPEPQKKRPWWFVSRWQGLVVAASGVVMLLNPITRPVADEFVKYGLIWFASGAASKLARDKFEAKPK